MSYLTAWQNGDVVRLPHGKMIVLSSNGHFDKDWNCVVCNYNDNEDISTERYGKDFYNRTFQLEYSKLNWRAELNRELLEIELAEQGVPTAAIAYSKKFEGVFKCINLGECVFDITDLNEEDAHRGIYNYLFKTNHDVIDFAGIERKLISEFIK